MEGFAIGTERNGGKPIEVEKFKNKQEGVSSILTAALDPSIASASGGFIRDNKLFDQVKPYASSKENASKLWNMSEEWVGQKFAY